MLLPKWDFNANKEMLLKMADDKNTQPEDIEDFFKQFFTQNITLLPIMPVKFNFLWRCSKNDDGIVNPKSDRIIFNNINQCSYPPDEYKDQIGLQRCNYKGQQVFYASAPDIITSETENIPIDGEKVIFTAYCETILDDLHNKERNRGHITFSKWKVQRDLWILPLPFSLEACNKNASLRKLRGNFEKMLVNVCKNNKIMYNFFINFYEFLSQLFHSNDDKKLCYKITSAFFNTIINVPMERHPDFINDNQSSQCIIDGLLYPSASTEALGNNICLRKELIDDKILTGEEIQTYEFKKRPTNLKEVNIYPVSNRVVPDINGDFEFAYIK